MKTAARPSRPDASSIEYACLDEGSSARMKCVEIECLTRVKGMSLQEACDVVYLDPEDYKPPQHQSRMHDLPTPDEIETLAEECREMRRQRYGSDRVSADDAADMPRDDDGDGDWAVPQYFTADLGVML